eukprot:TRINITY_DN13934_c0_g2_i16.p1 TRINITY_DN13934_c0_g2~~TRINITY_DN13934_c0_g2_i16.p1  ORF type:complete len:473 (+),score=112.42 TRINITY_DN13934_c0_g2_i16:143-1561(+)
MSTLKDFEVLAELGHGSFGRVFKVLRKGTDFAEPIVDSTAYVMKQMNANADTINEVSVLASVNSQYVVKYMDSFIEDGELYLIMEYCERRDIATFLASQMNIPLSEERIWRIALEILAGLAELHKKGIIHRDVKSKNVFLTRDCHAKIGDFGISTQLTGKAIQDRKELGTLLYTSPEICKGDFYSAKADIWSFGCLLYELCTFRTPFHGTSEEMIVAKILGSKQAPIPACYSADLAFVVGACLCKEAEQRPDAMELLSLICIDRLCRVVVYKKVKELDIELPEEVKKPKSKKMQIGGFKETSRPATLTKQPPVSKGLLKSILKKPNQEEKKQTEKPNKSQMFPLIKVTPKHNIQLSSLHKKTNSAKDQLGKVASEYKGEVSLTTRKVKHTSEFVSLAGKKSALMSNKHYTKPPLPRSTEQKIERKHGQLFRVSTGPAVLQKDNPPNRYSSVENKTKKIKEVGGLKSHTSLRK